MSTLHSGPCLSQYALSCGGLWRQWRTIPDVNQVRRMMTDSITSLVQAWMPPPSYTWKEIEHWGAFGSSDWNMDIQKEWTRKVDIPFNKFVELCVTLYHETRHAEQYYRVAQGLAAGRIEFPSTRREFMGSETVSVKPAGANDEMEWEAESYQYQTKDRIYEQFRRARMKSAPKGGRVKALVAAIDNGHQLPESPQARIGPIATYLGMSRAEVEHATMRRVSFVGFINSVRQADCMTRSTWLKTVEDWRDSFYRSGGQRISEFAQENDDNEERFNPFTGKQRGNIWEMYVNLPEEKDTYAIEALLRPRIEQAAGLTLDANGDDFPP